jgi:multidrug efflux pump subunit AcrA (membrane-fusion protein)
VQQPVNETFRELADLNPSQVVFGPATFLNQSAIRAQELLSGQSQAAIQQARQAAADAAHRARRQGLPRDQQVAAARAAGQQVLAQFQQQVLNLAVQYGQTGPPSLSDPRYVSSVVFDTRFAGGVPKEKFSLLFPSPESAQILVQLRPDLSEAERREAIIEDAVLEETPTAEALDDLLAERMDADWEEVRELERLVTLLDRLPLDADVPDCTVD